MTPEEIERDKEAVQTERRKRAATRSRAYMVQTKYGITLEQRDALLAAQQGKCALCGAPIRFGGPGSAVVDHCHASGKIRAILCHLCNVGLGSFRDNPTLLDKAKQYLLDKSGNTR